MAKGSGLGELLTLGVVGVGVYFVGNMFNWWGLFGGTATTPSTGTGTPAVGTTPASTTPAAAMTPTVAAAVLALAGPVSSTINNALKDDISINGKITNLACIPGGDCYDSSGKGFTAQLAALGVTPAQVYALMQAAYTPTSSTSTTTRTRPAKNPPTLPLQTVSPPAVHPVAKRPKLPTGMRGLSGPMVYATQRNYVRKGSSY